MIFQRSIKRPIHLFFSLSVFGLFIFIASCFYDNEEDLYPADCTTTNITYNGYVKTFVQSGCSCHTNGSINGNVNLNTYTDLKKYVDNSLFMKTIKHESGVQAMPPDVKKTATCDISKLEAWIAAGAKEN